MKPELVKEMIMRANSVQDQSLHDWFFNAHNAAIETNHVTDMAYNFERSFYTLTMLVHRLLDFVFNLVLNFIFSLDIPGVIFVSISFILVFGFYLVTREKKS